MASMVISSLRSKVAMNRARGTLMEIVNFSQKRGLQNGNARVCAPPRSPLLVTCCSDCCSAVQTCDESLIWCLIGQAIIKRHVAYWCGDQAPQSRPPKSKVP